MTRACIVDVSGQTLSDDEAALFSQSPPWAFVLFGRSCSNPMQMRALCDSLREAVGRDCLIFVDQEGGRVQRLAPPVWPRWMPASALGALWAQSETQAVEAVWLHYRLIALALRESGVNAAFAPCLDLAVAGAHGVIGDRAFSPDPDVVAALGAAALAGLADGGVAGCVKHMPGHGRARSDTHFGLPRIEASRAELEQDWRPFAANAAAPAGLTAHMVFESLDPERPATLSARVITEVIRGAIGFQGLLISDCLSMGALVGPVAGRALAALEAGCDIALVCNQPLGQREQVLRACPELAGHALERACAVEAATRKTPGPLDAQAAWARYRAFFDYEDAAVAAIAADPTGDVGVRGSVS